MAKQYKRIFAALDGGQTQNMVAERAIELAADTHAALMFGHVVDSVPYEAAGTDFAALAADMKAKLEESIADLLEEARNNPNIPKVQVVVKAGRITPTWLSAENADSPTSSMCSWAASPRTSSATCAVTFW